jgi:drug/metabolite transporter (DMT)-like permease
MTNRSSANLAQDQIVSDTNRSTEDQTERAARGGLWLGAMAVGFWSFGSSLIYMGAREVGTWRFVAIASLTGGVLQMLARRIVQGEIRTTLWLPWRLWIAPLVCFVVYGLAWPCALVTSKATQVRGVNLINYLWPVLTVVFSVWWVPGLRFNGKVAIATGLALAGLVCANVMAVRDLLSPGEGAIGLSMHRFLPYVLALVAALTWAIYSALLARWRVWARNYVTSPIGFIAIGMIACLALMFSPGDAGKLTFKGLLMTVLYGMGPVAAGYLLWELALAKAKVQTLSLLAAVTPVLSTLLLCCVLRKAPDSELVLATLLVSGGVWVSMKD